MTVLYSILSVWCGQQVEQPARSDATAIAAIARGAFIEGQTPLIAFGFDADKKPDRHPRFVLLPATPLSAINAPRMSQTKPLKIGELAFCECPPGVCNLPIGLQRNSTVEVVSNNNGTTTVKYYGRDFAVPTGCVHSQNDPLAIQDSDTGLWTKRSFEQ